MPTVTTRVYTAMRMDQQKPKYAERIRELRTSRKITLEDAARGIGIPYTALWRYEAGHIKNPGLETLTKMAAYYETSLDDIAGTDEAA